VAAPGVVFTIARAAEMIGETVDLIDEIAERGIESLKELIADQKR